MAKAYWISVYRSVSNPDKLAAYGKLAGPSIEAGGGKFLARGMPAQVYEAGLDARELDHLEVHALGHRHPDRPCLGRR